MKVIFEAHPEAHFQIISEGERSEFARFIETFPSIEWVLSPPSYNLRSQNMKNSHSQRQQPAAGLGISRNQHLLNRRRGGGGRTTTFVQQPPSLSHLQLKESQISAFDAFKKMVFADALIMSKSAFSYLAALYSRGTKYVPPDMWWTVPKWCEDHDDWIIPETPHHHE